jgi:hypothetical protein
VVVASLSALAYVGHGLIWVDNVWGRGSSYPPSSFSPIIIAYYGASLALAALLFLSGLGLWDQHRWGYWGSYVYCAATILLQAGLFALGLLLAPHRPDWPSVLVVGMIVSGGYSVLLLALLLLLGRGE